MDAWKSSQSQRIRYNGIPLEKTLLEIMSTESGCRGEEDYLNTGVILLDFKGVLQCHSCSDAKTSLSYCMEHGVVQGNWFTGQGHS